MFSAQKVSFKPVGRLGSMPLNGKEKVIDLARYKNIMTHLKQREIKLVTKGLQRGFHTKSGEVIKIPHAGQAKIKVKKPKTMEIFSDTTDHKK